MSTSTVPTWLLRALQSNKSYSSHATWLLFFAKKGILAEILLAFFHAPWYNVRSYWNYGGQIMVNAIVAAQFYFSYYYFFTQKK